MASLTYKQPFTRIGAFNPQKERFDSLLSPGDIIPYFAMCQEEGVSLQRGMNYRVRGLRSILLMSVRADAPYTDRVLEDGRVLLYEGHDAPRSQGGPDPKRIDQPLVTPAGKPTQNGLFYKAVERYKAGGEAELVRVYEKIRDGLWAYNGAFMLADGWMETVDGRQALRLRLEVADLEESRVTGQPELAHNRMIPSSIKNEVWVRDLGRCVECGATDNLHFDHIVPFSKGGSSLTASNIQLLCLRHNLAKSDRIQ